MKYVILFFTLVAKNQKGKIMSDIKNNIKDNIEKDIKNFIVNPYAVLREEFDDWAILFNPENADALGVNPVGVLIWKLLDRRHSLEDIVDKIKENFDKVPENVRQEIINFVEQLAQYGFLGQETARL